MKLVQPTIVRVFSLFNALNIIGAPLKFREYLEPVQPSKNFDKNIHVVVSPQYEALGEDEGEPTLDIVLSLFVKIILDSQTKGEVFGSNYDPIVSPEFKHKGVNYVFVFQKNFEDKRLSLILIEASNVEYFTHRKVKVCIG